jgi:hypothetical protein
MGSESGTVLLIVLGMAQMGCQPIDLQNGVDPLPGIGAQIVTQSGTQIWQTKRDNPPVWSRMTLRARQYAVRGPLLGAGFCPTFGGCTDAWEYDHFNLTAAQGPLGTQLGNPLVTWPLGVGLYEGADGTCSTCEGPEMPWEAHGLRLAPRLTGAPLEGVTEVQALRDDYDTAEAPEGTPGRFQLSPDVAVVPIRVIVMNPVSTPSFPVGWYSQDTVNVLFDDIWKADVVVNSEPSLSPDNVVGQWLDRTGCNDSWCKSPKPIQPDTIFEKCNVQFRVLEYVTCTVPQNAWNNEFTSGSQCNPDVQVNTRVNPAIAACLAEQDLFEFSGKTVVLLGSLVNPDQDCANEALYGSANVNGSRAYISIGALAGNLTKYVVAHELGHTLGLLDRNLQQCTGDNTLMCAGPGQQNDIIPPASCNAVHGNAKSAQDNFPFWP